MPLIQRNRAKCPFQGIEAFPLLQTHDGRPTRYDVHGEEFWSGGPGRFGRFGKLSDHCEFVIVRSAFGIGPSPHSALFVTDFNVDFLGLHIPPEFSATFGIQIALFQYI